MLARDLVMLDNDFVMIEGPIMRTMKDGWAEIQLLARAGHHAQLRRGVGNVQGLPKRVSFIAVVL